MEGDSDKKVVKPDVLVIGGGPAGCFLGGLLAKRGFSVLIVEEHGEIGKPVECAGLLSTRVFEIAKIPPAKVRGNPIRGARVISGESSFEFRARETKAYSVDRALFDRILAERAERAGAEILLKKRFKGMRGDAALVGDEEIRARVYVGADGVSSLMRREMGERIPKIIGASQIEAENELEGDLVEVYPCFLRTFFSWKIPFHEVMRVGAAGKGHSHAVRELCEEGEIMRGAIPLGMVRRSAKENVLLIGDAAGQVKPSSFGGIYPALRCAEIAADVIESHLSSGTSLEVYDRRWKKEIGKELKRGMWIHKIFHRIGEKRWRKLIEAMDEEDVNLIINYGDMDYPSRLLKEYLKRRPLKVLELLLREIFI